MTGPGSAQTLTSRQATPLHGRADIPGDKSVSHRALIFGAMAVGETVVTGLLEGEDVLDTAKAMRALGAQVSRDEGGTWRINGVGTGGFSEPEPAMPACARAPWAAFSIRWPCSARGRRGAAGGGCR